MTRAEEEELRQGRNAFARLKLKSKEIRDERQHLTQARLGGVCQKPARRESGEPHACVSLLGSGAGALVHTFLNTKWVAWTRNSANCAARLKPNDVYDFASMQ